MERKRLGDTNLELSIIGFGASPLGGVFGDVSEQQAKETVKTALEVRLFNVVMVESCQYSNF